MRWVLALAITCTWSLSAVAGDNWPQFLGPTANGQSDSTGLPVTWSETENVVWKTPIHDTGWSSPVIWGPQIWLTTATDDGKQSFVLCLDKETGKVLLDQKLWDNADPEPTRQYNSFASCTPVIEEGRVYVHFGSYGTACLDTGTLKVLWSRRDLPCRHFRGPGSSPILYGDLLIFHQDGFDFQYVIALNKQTGETVWKKDRGVDYGTDNGDIMKAYSTPTVFTIGGREQLISPTSKAVQSFDPKTGDELWRVRFNEFSVAARPMYGHGLLFIDTGFGKASLLALRPEGTGDLTKTAIVWKTDRGIPSEPSPILVDDLLYMVHDNGTAQCLEAETGKVVWNGRVGGDYSASPLHADGKLYLQNHQGLSTVLQAGRKFKVLATNTLDAGAHASPAVSGKALYLRTDTHLYRIEQK